MNNFTEQPFPRKWFCNDKKFSTKIKNFSA